MKSVHERAPNPFLLLSVLFQLMLLDFGSSVSWGMMKVKESKKKRHIEALLSPREQLSQNILRPPDFLARGQRMRRATLL